MIRDHRGQPGFLPPPKTPGGPAPKVMVPGITGPTTGTLALPDRYTAPTVNLTKIANALQMRHKSLSILITAPPGIAVTNPVNIKITYNSAVSGSRWRQGLYNPAAGYRDFQNDPEGNRNVRHMTLDILLTEQQPGNQFVNFAIKWEIDRRTIKDSRGQSCIADIAFDVTVRVRQYLNL